MAAKGTIISTADADRTGDTTDLLHAGYDLLQQGVGIFDADLNLVACNKSFRELRDYPAELCRPGVHIGDFIRHNAAHGRFGADNVEAEIGAWFDRVESFATYESEIDLADGRILSYRQERIPAGGLLVVYADVTEMRQAERALRESEARHQLVEEAATEGIYDWHIKDGALYASARLKEIFGFGEAEIGPRNWDWNDRVHPDDYSAYQASLVEHFKGQAPHHCEYRVRDKSGAYRWVLDRGVAIRDQSGEAVRLIGAITDIADRKAAEEALRASEERYVLVAQAASEGIYDWDVASDRLYISPRLRQIFHFEGNGLMGSGDWYARVHPDDADAYKAAIVAYFKGKSDRLSIEYRIRGKGDDYRWISDHGIAVNDDDGRAVRLVGAVSDITELKQQREATQRAEQQLTEAIASISEGFALYDPEDRLVLCNDKYRELYPEAADAFVPGTPYEDVLRAVATSGALDIGDDVEAWVSDRMRRHLNPGEPYEQQRRDGRWVQVAWRRTGEGGVVGVFTDITELKTREQEVRRQSLILEATLENLDQGISMVDENLNTIAFNRMFLELLDLPPEKFKPGFNMEQAFRYNAERGEYGDGDIEEQIRARLALARKFEAHAFERARPDGGVLEIRGKPLPDGKGMVATYTDITARKQAETALRESEERLALAMEGASEGLWDWNVETGEIFVSPRLKTVIGLDVKGPKVTPEEWQSRIHPDDVKGFREAMRDYLRGTATTHAAEFRVLVPGGEHRWVMHRGQGLRDEEGRVYRMTGSIIDTTERKQAELALRAAQDEAVQARTQLSEAIEAISEGFVLFDADDRIVLCNSVFREFFSDLADKVVPGSQFEELLRAGIERGLFSGAVDDADGWVANILERRRNPSGPRENQMASGLWLQISDRRTTDGGLVAIYTDVTELKERQNQLAEARDAAMQATQAKSQFLANMSHELRTPLNAILGLAEMLKEDAEDLGNDDFVEPLDRIHRAGQHLLHLINEVLDLSKIEAGKLDLHLEEFDVAGFFAELETTAQTLARKNENALRVRCPDDIGAIYADLTRTRQIVLNLLSNACKFTEKGDVVVDVARVEQDGHDRLRVEVTDSGIGMSEEQVAKLFQEFTQADSSTTRKYGGTGLGLAISQRLAHMMGGEITVASTPDVGTTFILEIPFQVAVQTPASAEPARPSVGEAIGGVRTVLVIDDDETVRDLMRKFLAREGCDVVTAADGESGLRIAREMRPSVITLDVMMPGKDGWEVLRELKSDPKLADIPVIMLTIVDDKKKGFSLGATEYMTKPIDRDRLRDLLAKHRSAHAARRVLVVEDDPDIRGRLKQMLESEGWTVAEAPDGRAALDETARVLPDLILLDLMMPEMDGFEFVEHFRRSPEGRGVPIVVITAADLSAADRNRLNGGVERILQKSSFDEADLLADVRALVDTYLAGER